MSQVNLNALRWYESLAEQNHRKEWMYNRVHALITDLYWIPAFQFVKAKTGQTVDELLLVDFNDQSETNILADMTSGGLVTDEYTDFDVLYYPNTIPLPNSYALTEGYYYLKLVIDSTTYFSEVFSMCQDVSDMIKIEYWHNKNFTFKDGLIKYAYPFKHRIYIPAEIARPSYLYEERVDRSRGRTFPREMISYKQYRFSFLAAEYFIDAIRAIRLHDNVEIEYKGSSFDVDEFLMADAEWPSDQSDVATVVCEFQTDTVIISDGAGTGGDPYTAEDGACLVADYTAVGYIIQNSDNWNNGTYVDRTGTTQQLDQDAYVLIEYTNGNIGLTTYQGGTTYTPVLQSVGESVYETAGDRYWLRLASSLFNGPVIESVAGGVVTGQTFSGSFIEVYVQEGTRWIKTGQGTEAEFEGAGIAFVDLGSDYVKVVASTVECPRRWESPIFLISEQAWTDPSGDPWTDPGGGNWIWVQ